jgi:branched-chain amino acid transport system permease protein
MLYRILTKTKTGLIIKASLSHPKMVSALGHDVPKVFTYVFGFGCGLAGLAGVLAGNVIGTEPSMALLLGPIVFVVIVVGGLGSLKGALFSSLLIGMIQTLAISLEFSLNDIFNIMGYDVDIESKINSLTQITISQLAPIVPYLLLIIVLIARPRGLFGDRDV